MKYTLGISFQSLNIGKNVGISGLLAFSLCHRLIGYAVTTVDLTIRGSQDICRSPPLVTADDRDANLEDGYQFGFLVTRMNLHFCVKLQVHVVTINPL